jgi:hypothetical protein
MEEILIKVKDEKESFFLKELLEKLKIKFESLGNEDNLSGEKFKQSVINGKEAYKNGDMEQFVKINRKDIWK